MISHINITSALAVNKTAIEKAATEEGIHMSYVPLSHIFERVSMLNFFLNGARTV
jgi:long-subunit acyl-CoA synthetase (AMP-forming)